MKRRILPVVLSGTAMAAAGAPAAAADWVRVDTPNFVVVGESGAKRVTQVAEQFERFREALARVLSASAASTPVPTTIVAFDALRSFGPYRPLYNGKPVQLNGYFASSGTHSVIALSLQNRDEALRTIFHEYTHLVAANAARGMPTWVSEGVAEYYSTFEIAGDGKTATLGRVIPEHLQQLNGGSLLKHEDLLEIDQESPLYNEGARRSLFYAQSWALVHMLLSGQPSRAKELATYAALTSSGTPSLEAWRQVFGTTDVARALREYVGHYRMRGYRFRFEREIETRIGEPLRLSEADVEAAFGDLLRHVAPERTEVHLRRAAALQPASARARSLLGLFKLRGGDTAVARALLLEAAAAGPDDWLVQYDVAAGLSELNARPDRSEGDAQQIRKALDVVLAARPNLAHAHLLRATVEGPTETGLSSVQRARLLAPGRTDYVFVEAGIRADLGDYAAARNLIAPLMSPRIEPELREQARTFMRQIVQVEAHAKEMAARPGETSKPAEAPEGLPEAERAANQPDFIPVYRELGAGEQRVEGTLEQIECARGTIVLHVRTADRVARFHAARLEEIEFITYRTDLSGKVSCGKRAVPEKVIVTWRAARSTQSTSSDGQVVAVEFPVP
jgi:hypothetical protein